MTTKEKIEILKVVRSELVEGWAKGFCKAFMFCGCEIFSEIKRRKPRTPLSSCGFWFPQNHEGREKRIKICDEEIEKLEKKLKRVEII